MPRSKERQLQENYYFGVMLKPGGGPVNGPRWTLRWDDAMALLDAGPPTLESLRGKAAVSAHTCCCCCTRVIPGARVACAWIRIDAQARAEAEVAAGFAGANAEGSGPPVSALEW
jgi:hypothetical protein